jgi:large subunit ribosomal protein L17
MVRKLSSLGVDLQHNKAILRGLVTSLFEHEAITTTHAKAIRTQREANRIIGMAIRSSPTEIAAKGRSQRFIFKPKLIIPKLFGEFADRYKNTAGGGFARILKLEPRLGDNAPQSIVELVGGKRDMKRAITARTVARYEQSNLPLHPLTQQDVSKILKQGPNAETEFRDLVETMKKKFYSTPQYLKGIPPIQEPKKRAPIKFVDNPLMKK